MSLHNTHWKLGAYQKHQSPIVQKYKSIDFRELIQKILGLLIKRLYLCDGGRWTITFYLLNLSAELRPQMRKKSKPNNR